MSEGFGVVTTFVNDGAVIVLSIFFELKQPTEGLGWTPTYSVSSLQKIQLGYFVMVYIWMLIFLVLSIKQVKDQKFRYLASIWNIVDIINLVLFLVGLVLGIQFMVKYDKFTGIDPMSVDANTILEMMSASEWQSRSMLLFGVNQLIMNIKLIKYIQALEFIPGLAMPVAALQQAGIEMLAFMVMLVIICIGFSQTFTAWFGDRFPNYHTSASSLTSMILALSGYPDYEEFSSPSGLQSSTQEAGMTLLSLYCYFFIFFFLVMLVAIQHVAYNKVRHAFLQERRRFLTLRQLIKLLQKNFKKAKEEVGTPDDDDDAGTFKGSWWAWSKKQLADYWQENFADFSIKDTDKKDDEALGDNGNKLTMYERQRHEQSLMAVNHLNTIQSIYEHLAKVLHNVSKNPVVKEADSDDEHEVVEESHESARRCCGLLPAPRDDDSDFMDDESEEEEVQEKEEDAAAPENEFQTGADLATAPGACHKALSELEEIDNQVRELVSRQQQQQANILHNCDLILSKYTR